MNYPLLHLYPQQTWHGGVHIVGNRKALEFILEAIDKLLDGKGRKDFGGSSSVSFTSHPSDLEASHTNVYLLEDKEVWDNLVLPYAELQHDPDLEDEDTFRPFDDCIERNLDMVSYPPSYLIENKELEEKLCNYWDLSDDEKRLVKARVRRMKENYRESELEKEDPTTEKEKSLLSEIRQLNIERNEYRRRFIKELDRNVKLTSEDTE